MTQPLYFNPDVQFEKTAAEVMLPEDANEWPNELMQELFKQCPFIADFEPHVVMDRVDAERGYGFGHVEIQNKTEIQHGAPPDATAAAGIKNARIPIVIKDLRLQPLDLLVTDDSKVLPMTEPRLRQAIFRPQAFDITGRGPGDMSMIGQLYPPYRQNYGFGGGGASMSVGMGKEGEAKKEALSGATMGSYLKKQTNPQGLASAAKSFLGRSSQLATSNPLKARQLAGAGTIAANKATAGLAKAASILPAILSTIRLADYENFFGKFASDQGLQAQYIANHNGTGAALAVLSRYEPVSTTKLAQAALENIKPSVAQLRKEAEGYTLKTASHACWMPRESHLDRGEAVRLLGAKVVLAADETGAMTMSLGEGAQEAEPPPGGEAEVVTEYGIYEVEDEKGNKLIGFVFPNLLDIDGKPLPIALFTNGSQMAVQSDIAGSHVGEGVSLFEGHPEGMGVFYKDSQATLPMTVKATMASPEEGGVVLHAETFDGREVQISVQPGIEAPMPGPEGEFLIPDSWSFLPLDTSEKTALISAPEDMGKQGSALRAFGTVTLRCGGDCFSIDGFPVEKLASEDKQFLSVDDTMFILAGLGTNLDYAQKKLGQAAAWHRPVEVLVNQEVKTAGSMLLESRKEAARVLSGMPDMRRDLVKEAAVIPDPAAVDTVLSLGFLNPENLGTFISAIPEIDASQMKMCELLLAARLGLSEVPAPALEKAIRATEETLEGLKVLAFQK
jgi:hypothetical protein